MCGEPSVSCETLSDNTNSAVWLARVEPEGAGTGRLVVFEPGGPGIDPLSDIGFTSDSIPGRLRGSEVVIMGRPSVGPRPEGKCESAAATFLDALAERAAAGDDAVASLSDACVGQMDASRVWLGGEQSIAAHLQKLANDREVILVGSSFGARAVSRYLAAVAGNLKVGGVIVVAPTPPGGGGVDVLVTRARATETALGRLLEASCDARSCADLVNDAVHAAAEALRTDVGRIAAFLIGASYALNDNEDLIRAVLTADKPDAALNAHVRRFSDRTLYRFGDNWVSQSAIAYWDGFCAAYSGWERLPAAVKGARSPVSALLLGFHRPCESYDGANWSSISDCSSKIDVPVCVITSTADPVAPATFARQWVGRAAAFSLVEVETPPRHHPSSLYTAAHRVDGYRGSVCDGLFRLAGGEEAGERQDQRTETTEG